MKDSDKLYCDYCRTPVTQAPTGFIHEDSDWDRDHGILGVMSYQEVLDATWKDMME